MILFDYVFLLCPAQQEHAYMSSTVQEKKQMSLQRLRLVLISSLH